MQFVAVISMSLAVGLLSAGLPLVAFFGLMAIAAVAVVVGVVIDVCGEG